MDTLLEKTVIDSNITDDKDFSLDAIIAMVAAGMSIEEIMSNHPALEKEYMMASFAFAKIS